MTEPAQNPSAAVEALLAGLGPPERMRAFYLARLGALRTYDREHNAELLRTLDAYFAAGRSPTATANRLNTHRNTVLYRLRRIEQLTQLTLRDPRVDLELQVALRIAAALNET